MWMNEPTSDAELGMPPGESEHVPPARVPTKVLRFFPWNLCCCPTVVSHAADSTPRGPILRETQAPRWGGGRFLVRRRRDHNFGYGGARHDRSNSVHCP